MRNANELTEFGVFNRYIRSKYKDNTISMSNKLKISRSFLSQIEVGIRPVPLYLISNYMNAYQLSAEDRNWLKQAVIQTNTDIDYIYLNNLPVEYKLQIMSYAYEVALKGGL